MPSELKKKLELENIEEDKNIATSSLF